MEILDQLTAIAGTKQVLCSEPMWKHTTFHIGGPADYFVNVLDESKLAQIIEYTKSREIPVFLLGNGSNLLVSDVGFRGIVLRLWNTGSSMKNRSVREGSPTGIQEDSYRIFPERNTKDGHWTFPAGMSLGKAAITVAQQSYTGFEFAAGIPGTIGGAVVMNAGAYGGEIKDCLVSARVMERDGSIRDYSKGELQLAYRSSILQKTEGIVLEAEFVFPREDRGIILGRIDDMNRKRREKQPLEFYSAGSTFKRPEGCFAGKLIMDAGLSGFSVGDARVSEKHCGFLINTGNATASQMGELIQEVIRRVQEHSGVKLEPEIRFLG